MAKLLLYFIYFIASVLLVLFLLPLVDPYARIESFATVQMHKMYWKLKGEGPPSSEEHCATDDETPEPLYRVQYSYGPGVAVYGWPPAKGGLYVLRGCLGLELDFLDLSRFENIARPGYDPSTGLEETVNGSEEQKKQRDEEEERHCDKMRMLGATWYESAFSLSEERLERTVFVRDWKKIGNTPYIKTGWPSDGRGVWVLNTTQDRASELGAARIYNARDMDERCRVIESIGGKYYSDPKQSGLDLP